MIASIYCFFDSLLIFVYALRQGLLTFLFILFGLVINENILAIPCSNIRHYV